MEVGLKILCSGLHPKIATRNQTVEVDGSYPSLSCTRPICFSRQMRYRQTCTSSNFSVLMSMHQKMHMLISFRTYRRSYTYLQAIPAVFSGAKDIEVLNSQLEDFSVVTSGTGEAGELKLSVEVSGSKTQMIFDEVFEKMVEEAQPIPGFRRIKGGKTPNIPKDVLLEVLGPTKVYKLVIKKVINTTIAGYVEKEGLTVSKDLRVLQSFEDLEAMFEAGEKFRFEAVIQLQEMN